MLHLGNICWENNVNYPKNDLNGCENITQSACDCQMLCNNTDNCHSFTWIGPSAPSSAGRKKCCLKNSTNPIRQTQPGFVSGPKSCGKLEC